MNELCRLCLCKEESLRHIYKEKLFSKIMACASIQVWEFDGLPKHICTNCYIKLELSYQFKRRCEDTDKILRKKFKKPENDESLSPSSIQMFNDADVYTIDIKKDGANDNIDVVRIEDEEATEINVHNMSETATDINLDVVITKTRKRRKPMKKKKIITKSVPVKKKIIRRKAVVTNVKQPMKRKETEVLPVETKKARILKIVPPETEVLHSKPINRMLPNDITVIPIRSSKPIPTDGDILKNNLRDTLNKLFKFKQIVRPYNYSESSKKGDLPDKVDLEDMIEAKLIRVNKIETIQPEPIQQPRSPEINFSIDDETMHELKYEDILQAEGILDIDTAIDTESTPPIDTATEEPTTSLIAIPIPPPIIENNIVKNIDSELIDVEADIPETLIRVQPISTNTVNNLGTKSNDSVDSNKSRKVILYVKQKINGAVVFKKKKVVIKPTPKEQLLPFLHKIPNNINNFCKICKKYFKSSETLEEHTVSHMKNVCPCCDRRFSQVGTADAINDHLKKHTFTSMRYKCETCGQLFTYFSKYETHLESHTVGKEYYKCNECDELFRVMNDMKRHMKMNHESLLGESLYCCVVCQETFYTSGELKIHVRRHRFIHRYVCIICNAELKEPALLTEHLKTHMKVICEDQCITNAVEVDPKLSTPVPS